MVFLPQLGRRGSLRQSCKVRVFGPRKDALGPVFVSQSTVKDVSFRGSRRRKMSSFTLLFDSKGTVFPLFAWKMYVFYWLFEVLFGCRENDVFYVYFEALFGFREKRLFGEKPSFAKV